VLGSRIAVGKRQWAPSIARAERGNDGKGRTGLDLDREHGRGPEGVLSARRAHQLYARLLREHIVRTETSFDPLR
jgi:hypothetical protein